MLNKRNLPLYIALAIPVLMIVLVAAFIYLPNMGKKPQYNFVYMTGNGYLPYGGQEYSVSNGHLVQNPSPLDNSAPNVPPKPVVPLGQPHFYVYDVTANSANEVSFQQAQALTLDPSNLSPDGYTLDRGNSGDFLFSGPSDYNTWYLKGHNHSSKLNVKVVGNDYYNLQFLGWVK